jgi:hypothetical protein
MMEMNNGTMPSNEEGENVKSREHEIPDNMEDHDNGNKSEGTNPHEEFKDLPDL